MHRVKDVLSLSREIHPVPGCYLQSCNNMSPARVHCVWPNPGFPLRMSPLLERVEVLPNCRCLPGYRVRHPWQGAGRRAREDVQFFTISCRHGRLRAQSQRVMLPCFDTSSARHVSSLQDYELIFLLFSYTPSFLSLSLHLATFRDRSTKGPSTSTTTDSQTSSPSPVFYPGGLGVSMLSHFLVSCLAESLRERIIHLQSYYCDCDYVCNLAFSHRCHCQD